MYDFPVALNLPLFARGTAGVPSSGLLNDDLSGGLISYSHAINDQGGFESATVERAVALSVALEALSSWLMRATTIRGPWAETVFEGFLASVEASFGTESRVVSVRSMANRVSVKATDTAGDPLTTTPVDDTDSQDMYGIKETIQSFDATDATDAANKANRILAELAWPQMERSSQSGTGPASPLGATLRCTFDGYYSALDWLTTENTTAATAVTTTQVKTLLTAYNAINNFFSTNQGGIVASGVSAPQLIAAGTTYRQAIEDLFQSGDNSGQALSWGVYEDRVMNVVASAKASPSTVTYQRSVADGRIYDHFRNVVPWWQVRPNAMYEVIELLDPSPVASQQDAAARSYVARVSFTASRDQLSLTLEGANGETIDKLLARMR
jgi:hypothetical protein